MHRLSKRAAGFVGMACTVQPLLFWVVGVVGVIPFLLVVSAQQMTMPFDGNAGFSAPINNNYYPPAIYNNNQPQMGYIASANARPADVMEADAEYFGATANVFTPPYNPYNQPPYPPTYNGMPYGQPNTMPRVSSRGYDTKAGGTPRGGYPGNNGYYNNGRQQQYYGGGGGQQQFQTQDYNNGRQQQYYGGGGGQQQYQTQAEGAFGYFGPWRESPYTFYNRPTNPAVASGVVSPYYSANAPYAAAGALTKQAVPFGQAVPDMLANNVTTFACGRSIDSCQLLLTKYKERIPCATQFDCTAIDPSSSCLTFSYGVTTPNVPNNPKVQVCVRCCADTVNQKDPNTGMGLANEFRCTNAAPIKRNLGLQTFNHPFCCANTQAVCGSATTNQFSLGRVSSVSSSVFESGIDGGGMLETRGMDQAAHQRHGVHRSDITGNDVPSNRGGGGRGGRG